MIKENLKIEISSDTEFNEAQKLLFSLGCVWDGDGLPVAIVCPPTVEIIYVRKSIMTYSTSKQTNDKTISFDELRELARPKEYLNDKFELVVTNRPQDGWRLIPPHMDMLTLAKHGTEHFWNQMRHFSPNGSDPLMNGQYTFNYYKEHYLDKILWQRNPKETTMNTEKKGREENAGRFLHQWAYEAFGRGEDVQFKYSTDNQWRDLRLDFHTLNLFNVPDHKFRIKPKTITIGTRTIVAPISVKPEIGTMYYIPLLSVSKKYEERQWHDNAWDNIMIDRNMIHMTADDALAHCDAILELMKRYIQK